MTDASVGAPTSAPAGSSESSPIGAGTSAESKVAKPVEPKAPEAPSTRTKKYKVNGKEVEIDLSDETRLDILVSKGLGADERFREAKKMMDSIESKYGKMPEWQKNPFWKVIAEGADPTEVAEQLLLEKIKWEEMTDEQREFEKTKRERDQLKSEREKAQEAEREKAQTEARAKAAKEIDDEVTTALKALGRKPTPRLIARIAETLIAEHERQIAPLVRQYGDLDKIPDSAFQAVKNLPASEAVGRVHKEYLSDIAEYLGALPIDEVEKLLPKQILDGLRQSQVQRVLSQDPMGSRKPRDPSSTPQTRQPAKKRMTTEEYFAQKLKQLG